MTRLGGTRVTARTEIGAAAQAAAALASQGASSQGKMSDAEFAKVSALVGQLTGIVIKDHKREMIHSRLSRRLRALGLGSFAEYLDLVESDAGAGELGELINAVTTNLTAFFRESHHFDHLRSSIIEPMLSSGAPRVRIWSAACSSGEEPYSIAMTALAAGAARHRDFKILATDLDTNILSRAANGVYPAERIKSAPDSLVRGAARSTPSGEVAFTPETKSLITFRQLNLLHKWPVSGPFDAIFCRNVLIYFDSATKRDIVDRLANLIRPEGALYLGHSESLLGDHPLLASEGRTIYRRRG